ncbi:45928_t:CDS:2 [Gigaspora margarita]|uniref:45928_t:CDS:1 n=1 Tax=Gigaspora margarita TaxID=4874 RepID=A0ABN7V0W6_GIGMA|nr:45928_t:CDS:2 [Gigaspora margarita]
MLSPNVLSKASKRNLRKKDLRATKKAKIGRPNSSIINKEVNSTSNIIVNQVDKRENIFYDPLKHKTQSGTRLSTKTQTQEYIRSYWESEDFVAKVFNHGEATNKNSNSAWKQFGLWAFFATSPTIDKQIRNHCQCLWSKVKYAYQQCIKAEEVLLEQTITSEALSQNLKNKQVIASVLTNKMAEENINIKGYHHIFDPQTFKNALGETMQ